MIDSFTMKYYRYCHILVLILLVCNIAECVYAQNIEQVYMKSGSVVEGYISEQLPGKHITVHGVKATLVTSGDSLVRQTVERLSLASLPQEWKNWAEQNGKLLGTGDQRKLELATLQFKNCKFENVFLLEKGSIIKFVDVVARDYRFVWGDMYRTVKSTRPDNLFSGTKEVLELNDNSRVSGQIVEQYPGKDLKILTEKGEVLSYKFSQVRKIITERLSNTFDLWTQIQLLDVLRITGEKETVKGFIVSRTLNKELVLLSVDGSQRTIPLSRISSYAKIPNEKYVAVYDRSLQPGEVVINGEPAFFVSLKQHGSYLVLDETVSAQMRVGDTVRIEANVGDNEVVPITLVKAHYEDVTPAKEKNKKQIMCPVITYQDLVQAHLPFTREKSPLGNVKVSFIVKQPGDFVLHIQGKEGYIIVNVLPVN